MAVRGASPIHVPIPCHPTRTKPLRHFKNHRLQKGHARKRCQETLAVTLAHVMSPHGNPKQARNLNTHLIVTQVQEHRTGSPRAELQEQAVPTVAEKYLRAGRAQRRVEDIP